MRTRFRALFAAIVVALVLIAPGWSDSATAADTKSSNPMCNLPAPMRPPSCLIESGINKGKEEVKEAAVEIAGDAASKWLQKLAEESQATAGAFMTETLTWWTRYPSASPTERGSAEPRGTVAWMQSHLSYLTSLIAVCGVVVAGVMVAMYQARGLEILAGGMGRFLVGWWIAIPGMGLLIAGGDSLGRWFLDSVDKQALGKQLIEVTTSDEALAGNFATGGSGTILAALLIGIVATIAALVQLFLSVLRDGLVLIVAGTLSLAAAVSFFKWGKPWFDKALAWGIALILYKPIACLIYAAALVQFAGAEGLRGALSGLALLVASVLALPALLRLTTPAAAAVTSGGGGMGGAGLLASGMRAGGPSGAVPVSSTPSYARSTGAATGPATMTQGPGPNGRTQSYEPSGAARAGAKTGTGPAASRAATATGTKTAAGAAGGPLGAAAVVAADAGRKTGAAIKRGVQHGTEDGGGAGPSGATK
ncbi:hypothetical protein [Nocardioides panzhihuensis]|uniref:TrbL/VirB6 plasmid conjugal transfer protein n=1 Tax=Nocardioides panzhihuensis TaxID=860243 RepID=A0A7Z0DT58_9ACTN|nr:hypothetical protein [Nocardioides panzhihuensis]NYI81212.1 hypothetical protein [Nocardioides panzhihuensis]